MTDKITSVAGLKKAINELLNSDYVSLRACDGILKLISEFEASVRERRDEWIKSQKNDEKRKDRVDRAIGLGLCDIAINELRRILGGEGERRG